MQMANGFFMPILPMPPDAQLGSLSTQTKRLVEVNDLFICCFKPLFYFQVNWALYTGYINCIT